MKTSENDAIVVQQHEALEAAGQRPAIFFFGLDPRGDVGHQEKDGRAFLPGEGLHLDVDPDRGPGAGHDPEGLVRGEQFAAQASRLPLDHGRAVLVMKKGGQGPGRQFLNRVAQEGLGFGIGKLKGIALGHQ